ncbi:MAG: DUF1592 domain-containing protein [Rhodospirillaceae bacterium]|nr:DUF1592 domain-containing protein [Rhodospirillaceae bacterium]
MRSFLSRTAAMALVFAAAGGLLACSADTSKQTASAPAAKTTAVAKDAVYAPRQLTMRRLSGEQYQNVIHDVFGPTIELGGRFEPDLRVNGLLAVGSGDVSITAAGIEQYDLMARRIASQIVDEKRRDMMLRCKPANVAAADDACAAQVMARVGRILYRRPLTQTELQAYVTAANVGAVKTKSFYSGLSLSLAAMLSSPKFLFRTETAEPDPDHAGGWRLDAYSKAQQLSFFLWNSGPDQLLLDAAESGKLNTKKGVAEQVERMIASPRLEEGVRAFFIDDFGFDQFETLTKDTTLFPKFSAQAAADAQEQTLRTVVDLLIKNKGDYRDIFTTKKTFITQELGAIYKIPVVDTLPNGAPDTWQAYQFPADDPRGGILTQVAFTALHSPPGRGSPTLRGKALREVLLCQKVPAPPANVKFDIVQDTNNPLYKTARDRLNAHATNPVCAGCHKIIDPIGLALENFDGAGAYRTTEQGARIDTSGSLDGVNFTTAAELGKAVHDNPNTPSCLVSRLSAYALGRPVQEAAWLEDLNKRFAAYGYQVPALMREIAESDNFFAVKPVETKAADAAAVPAKEAR